MLSEYMFFHTENLVTDSNKICSGTVAQADLRHLSARITCMCY